MKHSIPTTFLTINELTEMARLKVQEAASNVDASRRRELYNEAARIMAIVKERLERL